jgi:hypothetical protein
VKNKLGMSIKQIISIAVSLIVVALILPLGLGLLGIAGDTVLVAYNATGLNESAITLAGAIDPSVLTLLTVLIPILAVIGIAVAFVSTRD